MERLHLVEQVFVVLPGQMRHVLVLGDTVITMAGHALQDQIALLALCESRLGSEKSEKDKKNAHDQRTGALQSASSEGRCVKRVAGRDLACLQAALKPARTLLGRTMGEAVRHDIALALLLELVIANGGSGIHRFLDVALLQHLPTLVGVLGPDTGKAIGHQLHAHGKRIGFLARNTLLGALHLGQDAEEVFDMVPHFMRHNVGISKIAPARILVFIS